LNCYNKFSLSLVLLFAFALGSCRTYSRISNEPMEDSMAIIRVPTNPKLPAKYPGLNIEVRGNDSVSYYLFFRDSMMKQTFPQTPRRKTSVLYRLTFEQNSPLPFSPLDKIVFSRASKILDSLDIKSVSPFKDATGFVVVKIHK